MADGESTRDRLLAAALALVAADGVQAVTHRAVEERAGVARGLTRYHFGSREQLLAALVAHLAERDRETVAPVVASMAAAGDTPERLLPLVVRRLLADRAATLARFELYLYAARRPELAAVIDGWGRAFVDVGAVLLAARGTPDPDKTAHFAVVALDGIVFHALCRGDDPEVLAATLATLLDQPR